MKLENCKKEKILITVKTYPSLSKKYGELVCTAGINENGDWLRIYPIPFRKLHEDNSRYKKYQWIEADIFKDTSDPRRESHKINYKNIELLNFVETNKDWAERKKFVLSGICTNDMEELIEKNKNDNLSLATFKPTEIIDFIWEAVDRDYKKEVLEAIEAERNQLKLFPDEIDDKPDFKEIPKLPYEFSYIFIDNNGKQRKLMIEDWEVGAAYWNFLKHYGNEKKALEKVKDKFLNQIAKKRDLYFFLGTTRRYDSWSKNPFIIIGLFYPPFEMQMKLF